VGPRAPRGDGHGPAVVASGTGGSAEHLRDGENALLAPPGPTAWAAAITRLAEDPALRARLAAAGVATAREHTEDRFHDAVERVLLDLAPPGRLPR
jgi:glycosyltransferase involved in cell wall biosynthesis